MESCWEETCSNLITQTARESVSSQQPTECLACSQGEHLKDGATLRHNRIASRIAAMFSFIESCEDNGGASMFEIQAHMLQEFGLDYDTTERYIKKCATIGFLREQQGRWFVTSLCREISKNLDVAQC